MNHWFYVGKDLMWVALALYPLFAMHIADQNPRSMGGEFVFGVIIQCLWVAAAVNGWFK